ncbi:MAG: hypothetical protein HY683_07355 [Chloroflexi bacterium]|nr:hypothetical protein [Chloroflexota bacterium]
MRIEAPVSFWHAGDLPPRYASRDPRQGDFSEQTIDVDLRRCDFLRPPAVLWCVVYPLLAALRGSAGRLLVPENLGTCIYLKSVYLFSVLKGAGVEVDDRDVPERDDPKVVLPLTPLQSESHVEQVVNHVLDKLDASSFGAANLRPVVADVFGELAQNAVQHAESPVGPFGLIQFYESERVRRFACAVADGGIGIRRSLERNPTLRDRVPYDWKAIELATRERVSGTGDPLRGIGLSWVYEAMAKPGRQLIIHSGIGALTVNEEVESDARRTTLFPGTLAYASIET